MGFTLSSDERSRLSERRRELLREQRQLNIRRFFRNGHAVAGALIIPDPVGALRIWRRDRRKSPSPNSAQTESVAAGALHIKLLGDTWYFGELHQKQEIGDGGRDPGAEDITRAVVLMQRTSVLMFAAGMAVLILLAM